MASPPPPPQSPSSSFSVHSFFVINEAGSRTTRSGIHLHRIANGPSVSPAKSIQFFREKRCRLGSWNPSLRHPAAAASRSGMPTSFPLSSSAMSAPVSWHAQLQLQLQLQLPPTAGGGFRFQFCHFRRTARAATALRNMPPQTARCRQSRKQDVNAPLREICLPIATLARSLARCD